MAIPLPTILPYPTPLPVLKRAAILHLRDIYQCGLLAAETAAALQSHPSWQWHRYDEKWNHQFNRYRKHAGNPLFPYLPNGAPDDLIKWREQQFLEYRHSTLLKRRCQALEALPGWSWQPATRWQLYLKAFVAVTQQPDWTFMHSRHTNRYVRWAYNQAKALRLSKLSSEKAAQLSVVITNLATPALAA